VSVNLVYLAFLMNEPLLGLISLRTTRFHAHNAFSGWAHGSRGTHAGYARSARPGSICDEAGWSGDVSEVYHIKVSGILYIYNAHQLNCDGPIEL
jgi:hypothetical protein